MESNPSLVLAGKFTIKPEIREKFLSEIKQQIELSRRETGNITFEVYEDILNANSFIFFEEWQNKSALTEHLHASYTEKLFKKFPDFIISEPDITVYQVAEIEHGLNNFL